MFTKMSLVLILCMQVQFTVSGEAQSMSRKAPQKGQQTVTAEIDAMGEFAEGMSVPVKAHDHDDPIAKKPILSSFVRSLHQGKAVMDVEANGDLKMVKNKPKTVRTRSSIEPGSLFQHWADRAQCPKASAAKDTLDTGISTDVIPKLQLIEFNISLTGDERATEDAKAAAVAAQTAAQNASTKADECLGTESGMQATVARLTGEKANLTSAKGSECQRTESLKEYEFEMPASTHPMRTCNFSTSTVDHCWDTAYKTALEDLEREVQGQLGLYEASSSRCGTLGGLLLQKDEELDDAEDDRDRQKLQCDRKEQHRTTTYCHFSDKITRLCTESGELNDLYDTLEARKQTKRDAIRIMKVTRCLVTLHYTLGNTGCTGCRLGSKAEALDACDAQFPITDDYGVLNPEPVMVQESKTFFGLPGVCGSVGSDSVTFPGHLWTRDPTTLLLTRAAEAESTTITAIAASCPAPR